MVTAVTIESSPASSSATISKLIFILRYAREREWHRKKLNFDIDIC